MPTTEAFVPCGSSHGLSSASMPAFKVPSDFQENIQLDSEIAGGRSSPVFSRVATVPFSKTGSPQCTCL